MRRDVRILLVGDEGVGKSTLITSLIKETFVPNVQHVVPEVTIPPEVTPENVTTHIVDSSARQENRDQLDAEIKRADVICIVYSIARPETFDRIGGFWLPYIKGRGRNVPVVLVGNKIDLQGGSVATDALEDQIMPIMNNFKEVESCVACSAKTPLNVSEVFYFAQKAVLHPTAPLYDSREHTLKPACVLALQRIFKLCDTDKDGVLNDEELNEFQRTCFDVPLQQQELEGVKQVVRESDPGSVNFNGLTESGFLYLHTLFIRRGRMETTWTVLRKFGYGDDLSLREEYLNPVLDIPPDASVELSSIGYDFFTQLFTLFDKDKDGALSAKELDDLFSTSPGNPWTNNSSGHYGFPQTTITDENGAVTLQGFLAQWSMTTILDYKTTLSYLAYLGFPTSSARSATATPAPLPVHPSLAHATSPTALKITKSRRDRKRGKTTPRNCFLCYVFGAVGSGKTALLKTFVNKGFTEAYEPTTKNYSVVNSVEIGGAEKYLVIQEFGAKNEHEVLANRKKLEACDVLCLVYDSSDVNSFSYISNLRTQYELDQLPCVFVATKSDLDLVQQRFEVQPDVYCRRLGLAVPVSVSLKDNVTADLFNSLVQVAMDPAIAIPGVKKSAGWFPAPSLRTLGTVTVLSTFAVVCGVMALRFWKRGGPFGLGPAPPG